MTFNGDPVFISLSTIRRFGYFVILEPLIKIFRRFHAVLYFNQLLKNLHVGCESYKKVPVVEIGFRDLSVVGELGVA